MNFRSLAKGAVVLFFFWSFWVVLEWRDALKSLSSPARSETQVAKNSLASLRLIHEPVRGQASSFEPTPSLPLIPPALANTSNEAAQSFLEEKKREWGIREYHELRPTTYETPLSTKVKYSAYQDGLPIIGSEIMLEVNQDRKVSVMENNYVPLKKADLNQATLTYQTILDKSPAKYQLDNTMATGVSRILYVVPGSDEPEMSYVMAVKESGTGPTENLVFRAADGMVLGRQVPRSEF